MQDATPPRSTEGRDPKEPSPAGGERRDSAKKAAPLEEIKDKLADQSALAGGDQEHEDGADNGPQRRANKQFALGLVSGLCSEHRDRVDALVSRQTILRDPATRRLLLEHQARTNLLRRAVAECHRNRDRIPPVLEAALAQVLAVDSPLDSSAFAPAYPDDPSMLHGADRTAALAVTGNTSLSPQRSTGAQYAAQLRGAVANASAASGGLGDLSASTIAVTPNNATAIGKESSVVSFTRDTCKAHTPLSCRPLGVNQPAAVAAAHEARRCGRRRDEIAQLLLLLSAASCTTAPDPPAAMRVLEQLAEAHNALGEHDTAEAYAFDWVLLADRAEDARQAAKAMMAVADARRGAGDLNGAKDWLQKAAARARHS